MTITVLVVEDDGLIAEDYRMTIEDRGWEVVGPAASSEQALRILSESLPSVAILDLMLLHGLSTPVAEALVLREVPFILATGGRDPVAIGGKVFLGIRNLGKPSTPRALISALERALSQST